VASLLIRCLIRWHELINILRLRSGSGVGKFTEHDVECDSDAKNRDANSPFLMKFAASWLLQIDTVVAQSGAWEVILFVLAARHAFGRPSIYLKKYLFIK